MSRAAALHSKIAAPPRRSRATQSAETRERIIHAATELLSTRGYAGTTFMAIAQHTELSLGALQHHFPSKGVLMAVVARRLCAQRLIFYRDALKGVRGARARLEALLKASAEMALNRNVTAYVELELAHIGDPDVASALRPSLVQYRTFINELVERIARETPDFDIAIIEQLRMLNSAAVRGLAIEAAGGVDRQQLHLAIQRWTRMFLAEAFRTPPPAVEAPRKTAKRLSKARQQRKASK